ARLAADALAQGALANVSGARVGAELRLALAEPDPVATLAALQRLGILAAIDRRLGFDEGLARRGLAELPTDGRPDLLLLSSLLIAAGQDCGGVPAGPEIGRRLALVRDLRLDGELDDTREAQLQAALAAPGR